MIQLIGLRTYVDKETGEEKKSQRFLGFAPSVQAIFKDIDGTTGGIPEKDRWNVFYTVAHCQNPGEKNRHLRRFESQDVIAFDVDGLDTQNLDAYIESVCESLSIDKAKTGISFSGNGLHFIIGTENSFKELKYFDETRLHYRALCDRINEGFRRRDLQGKADPSIWDGARILRLPNTENRKPPPKGITYSRLINATIEPQNFSLIEASGIPILEKEEHLDEWLEGKTPDIDANEVIASCEFFKWMTNKCDEVREPHFYAGLSIIARFKNGVAYATRLQEKIASMGGSKSVSAYSSDELHNKMAQAIEASGPRTCKNINGVWGKCETCPHYKKIISPVVLKSEEHIGTMDNGFHNWADGKPRPNFDDLRKYFDQLHLHKTVEDTGIIYVWNGTHYKLFPKTRIHEFAQTNFDPLPSARTRIEFEQLLKSTNVVSMEFFNSKLNGKINFKNGVLDIKSKQLRPHDKELGFRYCLPYAYDPLADAPSFNKFLDDVTGGDADKRSVLEEYCGYALSGDRYWIHKCLLMVGEGANGKSTLIEVLQKVAGDDNHSAVPMEDLRGENNRQLLEGKLFNVAEEISHNDMKETKHLKMLSSGSKVRVKMMYNQPYNIESRAKLLFACNTLPGTTDSSDGFFRRMIIVPFNESFKGSKADLLILEKLETELPGIFNIFLRGYDRLCANRRFTKSAMIDEAVEDYSTSTNLVKYWTQETGAVQVIPAEEGIAFTSTEDLLGAFNAWAISQGIASHKLLDPRNFGKLFNSVWPSNLVQAGRQKSGIVRKRGFYGVKLLRSVEKCPLNADFDGPKNPMATPMAQLETE